MFDSYKPVILTGVAIAICSVCSSIGSYYILKSNLEEDVEEQINQFGYGGSVAMLQAGDVTAPEPADHSEMTTEELVKIISHMNSSLSTNIQRLRNMSRALDQRINSIQQKIKLFQESKYHA